MTETLRSSKFPGKVSSWAWDWRLLGKGACGEKGRVNMASKCMWTFSSRCLFIAKTRENPVANSCKYLFPFGLSWNTQQQFGRCVKTQMNSVAPHLRLVLSWPVNVLLRMPLWRARLSYRAPVPNSCCSRATVASVQSFWLLGHFRAPTQPKKPRGQRWPSRKHSAEQLVDSQLLVAQKRALALRTAVRVRCGRCMFWNNNWKHQNNNKIAVRENADLQVN